jgi:RNA polymerase sigma-70 factor (ECF subfamily)
MEALTGMLAEEVTLWADGGGKARGAATRPVSGRDAVARFILGTRRLWPAGARAEFREVNGQAALVVHVGNMTFLVLTIEAEQGRIQTIRILANPDKLVRI